VARRGQNSKYLCVRHNSYRKDSRLVGLFLCEDCFSKLKATAFNNYDPFYTIDPIDGYCIYCGQRKEVVQYFYFLCGICERIIYSYGRELAARNYLLGLWDRYRQEYNLDMDLRVEDPVVPLSYQEHRQYKRYATPRPDFVAVKGGKILFAIEMKTGRSTINEMRNFQLDKNDCDDIIAFLKTEQYHVPTFLVHVRVLEKYDPPTIKFIGKGAWWTSLFNLENAFIEIKRRPREHRLAVYYKVNVFRPIDELPNYIQEGLTKEFSLIKERLPTLYIQ